MDCSLNINILSHPQNFPSMHYLGPPRELQRINHQADFPNLIVRINVRYKQRLAEIFYSDYSL